MAASWEKPLARWLAAGVVDTETAARIRDFESKHTEGPQFRWSAIVALAFGGLLLGAGILLFVSAHWEELAPMARMALIVVMVAVFHVGGAFVRFPALSTTLHAVGTIVLGGAIGMAGQVYNMAEHWPVMILMWAAGAWAGVLLLRDWAHIVLAALLTPGWIYSESEVRLDYKSTGVLTAFLFLLSIAYMSAISPGRRESWRRALNVVGCVAVIPTALSLLVNYGRYRDLSPWALLLLLLPAIVAWMLRGSQSWQLAIWLPWALALTFVAREKVELACYFLYAAGSLLLLWWGMRESRAERVNIGVAGFAGTVLVFYFSNVMSTLNRSLSLILLGVIFLAGGWQLEKLRRRLIQSMEPDKA